jgi:AcrR family transcriptional regulator
MKLIQYIYHLFGGESMSEKNFKVTRQNKLLELATSCLARNPNASLLEIADFAGVGIATLHRYFPSRDELLHAISSKALDLVEDAIGKVDFNQADIRLFFHQIITELIPLGDRVYFLAADIFVVLDEELSNREMKIAQRFIDKLTESQVNRQLRTDLKAEWMYDMMYHTIFLIWKNVHAGKIAAKDAPELVVSTLLDGFRQSEGTSCGYN